MIDDLDPKTEWVRVTEVSLMGAKFVPEGRLRAVTVNGHTLCLVRKGDRLLALRNRCPHAGGPLHQGWLDADGNVVCPWHRFAFCPEDGKSAEGYSTETYPVQIVEDGTYIGFPRKKAWWQVF